MKLNPFHPARYWTHLGRARFVARRYADALEVLKKNTAPDCGAYALMAASAAYLGEDARAKTYADKVLEVEPQFTVTECVQGLHYQNETDRDHHRQGLLKAGLPA